MAKRVRGHGSHKKYVVNSFEELESVIFSQMHKALNVTTDYAAAKVDVNLQEWYDDYDPRNYTRTNQLLNSCEKNDVEITPNGMESSVYIDYNAMTHLENQRPNSEYEIVVAASQGEHGKDAYDEVTLNPISHPGNKPVKLWVDAMNELRDNDWEELVQVFDNGLTYR